MKKVLFLVIVVIFISGISAYCATCDGPSFTCDVAGTVHPSLGYIAAVDCSTYSEVTILGSRTPTNATPHNNIFKTSTSGSNCNNISPAPRLQLGQGQTQTKSIEHSVNGSLKAEVGFNLGSSAASVTGLTGVTVSDGWKHSLNNTSSISSVYDTSIPSGYKVTVSMYVTWKDGNFNQKGHRQWKARVLLGVPSLLQILEWTSDEKIGRCKITTSQASTLNEYQAVNYEPSSERCKE